MTRAEEAKIASAILNTLVSPNECDSNFENANVVDGLFAIARALRGVAEAIQSLAESKKEEA